ncbi:hypothetical protein PRUB_a1110 [Pseudoalteromonas rubra]|uniref:Uncharacterized protein n=1 Tax=Pseudoalteromonas rubra TaxID=43658 RepID=A0A8T0C6Y8_9GAMM|nr:hypothetical protein [Pseudoalteromonas rubra]KAF7786514.1 hypothetical protein PRUB_a1110 [Pseudoalteromonas rubra]
MKVKINKLKNLSGNNRLSANQTPQVAGGKHIEITNYRQCVASEPNWGCTGGACRD